MRNQPATVLLVEDDEVDALLVRRLLQASPHGTFEVDHVATVAEAGAHLRQTTADVVLLDLSLPDSLGIDTVLRIRNEFPHLPVVVLTGLDDEGIGLQAVECGAQDFVPKGTVAGERLFHAIRFGIARQKQVLHYKATANTDALTGLANRRAFDADLVRCIAESQRHQRPLSLMLVDVDHFKRINDSHGHRAGDLVLSNLGGVLSESVREVDYAARFGGEEFAVLLPSTLLEEAEPVMRRLLHNVAGMTVCFEGLCLRVTVSIGLAACNSDADELVQRADAALYAAKNSGRNRACVSDCGEFREVLNGRSATPDEELQDSQADRLVDPSSQPANDERLNDVTEPLAGGGVC